MRLATVIAAVAVGAVCSGCVVAEPPPPEPTIGAGPIATVEPTVTAEPRPNTCETDDVCFTYADMQAAYNRAIEFVAPFFRDAYAQSPEIDGYVYVASAEPTSSACGDIGSDAAAYCPGDRKIYMGQDALWQLYDSDGGGDAGLALALAHEYGHHLQTAFGVPEPQTERETIPLENQADCVAGAWMAWAVEQGFFVDGEEREIAATLASIASIEGVERSHGILAERAEAVSLGLGGGLAACNDFYSSTPLIT